MEKNCRRLSPADGIVIPAKLIVFLGSLFSGLGCYFCIAYSYLFQYEKLLTFTTSSCPERHSSFPSVSYTIGVFEPQKYVWLLVAFIQTPPQLLLPILYGRLFEYAHSLYSKSQWFWIFLYIFIFDAFIMIFALASITIINIQTSYTIHSISFMIWLAAGVVNLVVVVILHALSGLKRVAPLFEKTFYARVLMMIVALPFVAVMLISCTIYTIVCTRWAYISFSISEYIVIGIISTFNFLLFFEAPAIGDGLNLRISMPLKMQQLSDRNDQTLA